MSKSRLRPLTARDERFLIVRTMSAQCSPGSQIAFTNPWHQLVLAATGAMIVKTPSGSWSTAALDAVWVPAGVRHEVEMCGPVVLRNLYLRPTAVARLAEACCAVEVSPLLREIAARIASEGPLDRRVPWHRGLLDVLAHEIRVGAATPRPLAWPVDPRAARIASALQSDPGTPRSLSGLCREARIGPRTVQRLFPQQTGLTFAQWRGRLRHLHAVRLLGEGRTVEQAARECGYQSTSAFVAAFRQWAGIPPGQFCRRRRLPSA